jgi:predicted dehydrogenase
MTIDAPGLGRLAIVGFGRVALDAHVPALLACGLTPSVIVEPGTAQRAAATAQFPHAAVCGRLEDALEALDVAIVAAPPHLHEALCRTLLQAGKPVLVEKPLAHTLAAAERLMQACDDSAASLHVAYQRRQLAVNRWVSELIASGELGAVTSIDVEDGGVDTWETTTSSRLLAGESGGGVLRDVGVHVLDILASWVGELEALTYADDARGGVEAEAEFTLQSADGVSVSGRLSRLRGLRNTAVLRFARGQEIEVGLHANTLASTPALPRRHRPRLSEQQFTDLFTRQLREWRRALAGTPSTVPDVATALATERLVTACYGMRAQLRAPWEQLHGATWR